MHSKDMVINMKNLLSKKWSKVLVFILFVIFVGCTVVMAMITVAANTREVYRFDSYEQWVEDRFNMFIQGRTYEVCQQSMSMIHEYSDTSLADIKSKSEERFSTESNTFYFDLTINGKPVAGNYNNQKSLGFVTEEYSEYFDLNSKIFSELGSKYQSKVFDDYNNGLVDFKVTIYPKLDARATFESMNSEFLITTKLMFDNKTLIIFGDIGFVILCLLCFIYLLCAAGKKEGVEGIHLNKFDKIPMDILLVLLFICACFTITSFRSIEGLVTLGIFGVTFVPVLMSFSARIKEGKWWQNTVAYRIIMLVVRGLTSIDDNISKKKLIIKSILITAIILFVQVVCSWFGYNGMGLFVIIMMFETIVLVPVIATGILWVSKLKNAASSIANGDLSYKVDTDKMKGEFKSFGEKLNSISDGMNVALDEKMKSERLKTELITNVSHDIKTPLTSIINYIDLIGKENTDNENIKEYTEVLSRQSEKLKKLIIDLIDASKISTGNVETNLVPMDICVVATQLEGEYGEKFEEAGLDLEISTHENPIYVMADGKHIQRIFDNLLNNAIKYSLSGTRVYIDVSQKGAMAEIAIKNMSKCRLNISADELMDRFVRGDSSRHTDGNGLGLSIAQSLAQTMGGTLKPIIDGDLFKVIIEFKVMH